MTDSSSEPVSEPGAERRSEPPAGAGPKPSATPRAEPPAADRVTEPAPEPVTGPGPSPESSSASARADPGPTRFAPGAARPPRFTPPRSRQYLAGIGRRGWTWIVAGSLAVIVVLVCGAALAITATFRGAVDRTRHDRAVEAESRTDVEAACLDLETRLNRLIPPGATGGPAARAKAIRDENVAARPFLLELERLRTARDGDAPDEDYLAQAWPDGWRLVIEARSVYADALDRAATGGEPAFYLAPRDEDANPVADRLIADGPDGCDGALRRLTNPSL